MPALPVYSGNITITASSTNWIQINSLTAATISTGSISTSYASSNNSTNWMLRDNYFVDISSREATPEEIVEREAAQIIERERRTQQRQQRATATERAAELLFMLLDDIQTSTYREDQTFELVGSHGGRYRIRPGAMGNVDALHPETGERTAQLCAHPSLYDGHGTLPDPDIALAQLLHLTTDEPGFCRLANVHQGRRPEVAQLAALAA